MFLAVFSSLVTLRSSTVSTYSALNISVLAYSVRSVMKLTTLKLPDN